MCNYSGKNRGPQALCSLIYDGEWGVGKSNKETVVASISKGPTVVQVSKENNF